MKPHRRLLSVAFLLFLLLVATMSYCLLNPGARLPHPAHANSSQQHAGRFRNPEPDRKPIGLGKTLAVMWDFLFNKPAGTVPDRELPVQALSRADLDAAPRNSLWRLGHSTVLIKLDDGFFLTDPVFAERASPFSWMGPKRFHAPPIAIEELPPLRAVLISHDHYDHLDRDAVRALAGKAERFVTPLGVGERLIAWGLPADRIVQLDWWQRIQVGGTQLVCTPARHFSGRGLNDRNRTLWSSWAVLGREARIFFSGDSGYFDGFKTIGERLGPFDIALVETGAYDAQWPDVHMLPEESLQAHRDLGARLMLPVHNGTFDLALHGWQEPMERITALAAQNGVELVTPRVGARLGLFDGARPDFWWR